MRNMNCRNVRREIEETDAGELLSVAAREHVAICTACETLSREQTSLQTIISSLGTVEAPGDFDFRLRARLAGERRGNNGNYALGSFSFGLRAAAMATVLLLLGSAFVFVTFRTRPNGPETVAVNPDKAAPVPLIADGEVKPVVKQPGVVDEVIRPVQIQPVKRSGHGAVATARPDRSAILEQASTSAPVVRFNDSDEIYPTTAFPIDASSQPLRVSVKNDRGASRTISLPTVSFGSQKALSQSGSPLMASARGVW